MGKIERSSQSSPNYITPLLEPLSALLRLFEHFDNKGVIIGGIAASLLGKPRLTADLDAVILLSVEDLPNLIEAAAEQGIAPRMAEAKAFARKNRVLLLQHQISRTNIDISLGILPFEVEMVEHSQILNIGGLSLRLPTPEDLIIMKAIAHRPKDLADIQAIAASHPQLDQARIRYWLDQFGEALDLPNLWEEIVRLIEFSL